MDTFLLVLQFVIAVALTVVIMLQPSKGEGLGSIGGGARMFFRKAKGWELILERATVILAVLFMTLSVVLVVAR
ncbi:MAG: preprotein translocase subunit SecG [Bacillota bacterium]